MPDQSCFVFGEVECWSGRCNPCLNRAFFGRISSSPILPEQKESSFSGARAEWEKKEENPGSTVEKEQKEGGTIMDSLFRGLSRQLLPNSHIFFLAAVESTVVSILPGDPSLPLVSSFKGSPDGNTTTSNCRRRLFFKEWLVVRRQLFLKKRSCLQRPPNLLLENSSCGR